jgi:hypothetical protein
MSRTSEGLPPSASSFVIVIRSAVIRSHILITYLRGCHHDTATVHLIVPSDTTMSTPAVPPPQYSDHPRTKTYGAADDLATDQQALLGRPSSSSRGNAWIDQPEEDDLPDDFKVGVNVADCDVVIRMAFVRKIYS